MTVYAGETCVPGDCFNLGDVWVLTGGVVPVATTLTLNPAVGIYSGTTDLQATLSSSSGPVSVTMRRSNSCASSHPPRPMPEAYTAL